MKGTGLVTGIHELCDLHVTVRQNWLTVGVIRVREWCLLDAEGKRRHGTETSFHSALWWHPTKYNEVFLMEHTEHVFVLY